ncbi:hypothetical protein [Paenirhodobacter sp.]|uniref:hypothetical protein n=1 Tax=Paenirhodobacter sp. TaxID=1965326 RepID=UPI003B40C049
MMDRLTDPETLRDLARWLEAASLSSIEITQGDTRIVVRVGAGAEVARPQATEITAPIAGHALNAHPLRAASTDVAAGEAAGFVRVGPVLVPALAPRAGHVTGRAAEGALIGFGDTLLSLEAK